MADEFVVLEAGGLDGFQTRSREANSRHAAKVASAAALWADLMEGRVPSYYLQEALAPRTREVARAIEANYPGIFRLAEAHTSSDFPLLTGDVLDRMMLARYRAFPSAWRAFTSVRRPLRDFRSVRAIAVDGAEGQFAAVPEQAKITYGTMDETGYLYAPTKYAQGIKVSFEALMNDDLGAFDTVPDRLGRGGARTVAKFVTGLYVDASGPHASFFTVGNANLVTGNPVLSVASLGAAMTVLANQVDAGGEPIIIEEAVLVVPPALRVTANNILNQVTVELTTAGGASGQTVTTTNWIANQFTLAEDPYIPIVASSANGATSWFVFANPSVGRPALEVGFLNGFQEPALYQKLANTIRIGGGVDQMAGDFGTMSQEYKAVVAFGGTRLNPKSAVGSNGSGS